MTDPRQELYDAALALFQAGSRKGMFHVTGEDGSDRLVAVLVPPDAFTRLGGAVLAVKKETS